MSSWQYAFLFAKATNQLCPANAIKHLTGFGAEFYRSIRRCVPIDNEGHLLDVGEEVELSEPLQQDIVARLDRGESFSIQLRSINLVVSVEFLLCSPNPHISIGWSRRLSGESPSIVQQDFWKSIRMFAKDSNAEYVVIVDDASDHFEDRFVEIDGTRVFELNVDHPYGSGVRELWLKTSICSKLPQGATYGEPEQIGEGYKRYRVTN